MSSPSHGGGNSSSSNPNKKKKKAQKGPAPAHQNATAWRHNPKSKKTAKILAAPIAGVCRRCHQKLEWRKRYRKYKPRTVPGTCNLCQQRNVHAAYHTICGPCSRSNETVLHRLRDMAAAAAAAITTATASTTEIGGAASFRQICCVCVKEPSLEGGGNGPGGAGDMASLEGTDGFDAAAAAAASNRPLRLRQPKTLERQQTGKAGRSTSTDRPRTVGEPWSGSDSDPSGDEDEDEGGATTGDEDHSEEDAEPTEVDNDHDDDDDEDPFLRAVGGKDKLLVGEAYQQRLLKMQLQDSVVEGQSPS